MNREAESADAPRASKELERLLSIVGRAISLWRLTALLVVLGVGAGGAVIALRKPVYRSETVILYREGIRPTLLGAEGGAELRTLGLGLREMLFARPGLQKIIETFDLYPKTVEKRGYVDAVDEFRQKIVFQSRASDTFSIMFEGRTPDEAQQVVAKLAENLIAENRRVKIEQAKSQTDFLETQRKSVDEDLKKKEKALAEFLAQHPEFALEPATQGAAGASIRAERQAKQEGPDGDLLALERQAARSRTLLKAREGGLRVATGVPVPPELEQQRTSADAELSAAQRDLADKSAKFTEVHPDVVAAKAKVSSAQKKADDVKAKIQAATAAPGGDSYDEDKEKSKLSSQVATLEAEIDQRKKKKDDGKGAKDKSEIASRIVAQETEWARVNRDVADVRDRMADVERRVFRAQIEASSALGGLSAQIVVIDPAYKPTQPSSLPKSVVLVIAFAASLVVAAVVALLRALLDDRIFDAGDLARVTNVLATVPDPGAGRRRRG